MAGSRQNIVVALVLSLVGGVLFAAVPTDTVAAVSGTGYFTGTARDIGAPSINTNDVISPRPAVPSYVYNGSNDKADFINWVDSHVTQNNTATTQNQIGGALIVNTMLGRTSSTRTKNVSTAMWNDFVARVNNPNIRMQLVTADPNSYSPSTSFYDPASPRDNFFANWNGSSRPMILFRNTAGTVLYVLEIPCANPLGSFPGLPTSPATISALSRVNGVPGPIDISAASDDVRFAHYIRVTNYGGRVHTVGYRIDRQISTSGTCPGSGYTNGVSSGTLRVTGNGTFRVWGTTTLNNWDRDTTKRICQRIVITNRGGANLSGSSGVVAYANVLDGTITVGTSSAGYLEPGAPFSLTTFVNADADGSTSYSMSYDLFYTTNVPGLTPPGANNGTVVVSNPTNKNNNWNGTIPINAPAGTQICMNAIVTDPTQDRFFTGGIKEIRDRCITVVHKPIVNVDGGDVAAGMGFESGGVCAGGSATAAITGWPNAPTYNGAGTEFGAFALGRITGFASAQVGSGAASAPRGLSFANLPASMGEDYGGSFGSLPCIYDYYGSSPASVSSLPNISAPGLQNASSGHFNFTSGIIAQGGPNISIPAGSVKTVYVDGDLRIGKNVVYAGRGGWATLADIPGVRFVVRGNIYIHRSVTQLDGVYIAQPNPGVPGGGTIYTCVEDGWSPVVRGTNSNSSLFSQCNTPLTINGTFSAERIEFLRTYGTAARGEVAEKFNYLPELWQTRWPADGSVSDNVYDSITALPPIL